VDPMKTLAALLLLTLSLSAAKKTIVPPEMAATAATAPYSPGILVDGTLYVSGTIGQDLKTSQIPAAFEEEVKV
jgi:enamine deaminase RidA (YjgF/YER057c/UK114 family)